MLDTSRVIRIIATKYFLLLALLAWRPLLAETNSAALDKKNAEENAAIRKEWESWNAPFKPLRIIGNVYYVGPAGISSFLITTPKGHILLDTGFESSVPGIRKSIEQLGFKLSDIKIILNSHAHLDHCGGHAAMKLLTGAEVVLSAADADLAAQGGRNDFTPYTRELIGYAPVKADRIVQDGDKVTLGDTTLTCHLTPGHTKGCTTWTMDVIENDRLQHVLFFGSTSVLQGVPLVNNTRYPQIADDLAATYRKLKTLPCDVFLAPHAGFFDLENKAARKEKGGPVNPFIDPSAFPNFITKAEKSFYDKLKKERDEAKSKP